MGRCSFCGRPAEQRIWVRRWPLRDGRRVREAVEDVRIALCLEHLAERILGRRLLRKDGWAYG